MRRKRLNDAEIRDTVEKIRELYADYLTRFIKPRSALGAFGDRYIQAMRARMDLDHFLFAELNVVKDLIRSEEARQKAEEEKRAASGHQRRQELSIAERVLAEHRQMIEKYPPTFIHDDASSEVQKLYGTLGTVERDFWPDIERYVRKAYTSAVSSPRVWLEPLVLQLCRLNTDGVPPRLSRYKAQFERFPRNYPEIEKEEKKCILDAAHFLHWILDTLKELGASENLTGSERQNVDGMTQFVQSVIADFRLKDFRPTKR